MRFALLGSATVTTRRRRRASGLGRSTTHARLGAGSASSCSRTRFTSARGSARVSTKYAARCSTSTSLHEYRLAVPPARDDRAARTGRTECTAARPRLRARRRGGMPSDSHRASVRTGTPVSRDTTTRERTGDSRSRMEDLQGYPRRYVRVYQPTPRLGEVTYGSAILESSLAAVPFGGRRVRQGRRTPGSQTLVRIIAHRTAQSTGRSSSNVGLARIVRRSQGPIAQITRPHYSE